MFENLDRQIIIWWFISVVVVGILINIISSFIFKKLDNRLSNFSSWWKSRSEVVRVKKLEEALRLVNNEKAQTRLGIEEMRYRAKSIDNSIFSLFLFLVVFQVGKDYLYILITGGVFIILSSLLNLFCWKKYKRIEDMLELSKDLESKLEKPS